MATKPSLRKRSANGASPPALMAPMPWAITTAGCGPGLSGRYSQASSSSPEAVGIRTVVRRGVVEIKARRRSFSARGNAAGRERLRRCDPAATGRFVQARVRPKQLGLRRDVCQLGVEQRLLGVGDFQINGRPFVVAQRGEVAEALQCRDVPRLHLTRPAELRAVDQRVLHVLESDDDRFLIGK